MLSAGGSAKSCRDKSFQAIYSLRGKPLNSHSTSLHKILSNKELNDLINILGGIGEDFSNEKLKYNKIILMADSDIDGSHITCLLLTFIFKFYKNLINEEKIYLADTPLFSVKFNGKRYYFKTEKEKDKFIADKKSYNITRFKGLGEMNPEQLWEVAMSPKTRKLIPIKISDLEDSVLIFEKLMGKDPEERKEFILQNSHSANIDL